MAQIRTINDARAAGKQMAQESINEIVNKQNSIRDWLNQAATASGDESFGTLATLLAMPDSEFAMLAPAFLSEIEKSYNDPNMQMFMAQTANIYGYNREDVQEEYETLCSQLDIELGDNLSKQKIDFIKEFLGAYYNALSSAEGLSNRIINIPIEICHKDAKYPAYAHMTDSGMDVFALEDIDIAPGETKLIKIGVKVAIPNGFEIQVRPKSGRCLKTKLRVANAPGTIDSGYRDEIGVIIDNIDPPIKKFIGTSEDGTPVFEYGSTYTIGKGEKFAQLVLCGVPKIAWTEVEHVSNIGENRGGGFGSTGLK